MYLLNKFGLVAHLVERLICTEEVAGSSPVESTKADPKHSVFRVFAFVRHRQDLKRASGEATINIYLLCTEAAGSGSLVSLETESNKVLSEGDQVLSSPPTRICFR